MKRLLMVFTTLTCLYATPSHALGRGHGPFCYMAHTHQYCDADKPREVYEQEERENRALGQIGAGLQGAGAALQGINPPPPPVYQQQQVPTGGPQFYNYQDSRGFNHNCQVTTFGPNTTARCN
jgi:hypothetical protein